MIRTNNIFCHLIQGTFCIAQDVILNRSFWYFKGLPAVLWIIIGEAGVMFDHNKDKYNRQPGGEGKQESKLRKHEVVWCAGWWMVFLYTLVILTAILLHFPFVVFIFLSPFLSFLLSIPFLTPGIHLALDPAIIQIPFEKQRWKRGLKTLWWEPWYHMPFQ